MFVWVKFDKVFPSFSKIYQLFGNNYVKENTFTFPFNPIFNGYFLLLVLPLTEKSNPYKQM